MLRKKASGMQSRRLKSIMRFGKELLIQAADLTSTTRRKPASPPKNVGSVEPINVRQNANSNAPAVWKGRYPAHLHRIAQKRHGPPRAEYVEAAILAIAIARTLRAS